MKKLNTFFSRFLTVVFIASSLASNASAQSGLVASKELVCRGQAGYAHRLSIAAAKSLVKAGYKNFTVQVSSTQDNRDPRIALPEIFSDDVFKIEPETISCPTVENATTCKIGAKATFVGEIPQTMIPCSISKIFTTTVTLSGNRKVSSVQTLTVPGTYVHPSIGGKDAAKQSAR